MTLETARSFFLWCSVINYALLLVWALPVMYWRDGLHRLWGRWFRLSLEQFDMINIAGITLYKMGVILFNVVPCICIPLFDESTYAGICAVCNPRSCSLVANSRALCIM